ncbi:MAG: thioredoxin [Thermoleophilaceae bacterium]
MAATIVTCPHCGKKNRVKPVAEGVPRCANCHNLLPWKVDADSSSFDAETKASVPVVVDFWAAWCGPCKMIEPILETLAQEHAGRLKVVRLNVDENQDIAARFQVQGIPLLVLFRDGKEIDRLVGAAPKPKLEQWLEPHLGAPAGAGT